MPEIRCPSCGEANPEDTRYCRSCRSELNPLAGGRLDSSGNAQGLDNSTAGGTGTPDGKGSNDWLDQLRDLSMGFDQGIPENESASALPQWLSDISVPGFPTDNSQEEEIPDWITRLKPVVDLPDRPEIPTSDGLESETEIPSESPANGNSPAGQELKHEYPGLGEIPGQQEYQPSENVSQVSGLPAEVPTSPVAPDFHFPDLAGVGSGFQENLPPDEPKIDTAGISDLQQPGDFPKMEGATHPPGEKAVEDFGWSNENWMENSSEAELPQLADNDPSPDWLKAGENLSATWQDEAPLAGEAALTNANPVNESRTPPTIVDWQAQRPAEGNIENAFPAALDLPDWMKGIQTPEPGQEMAAAFPGETASEVGSNQAFMGGSSGEIGQNFPETGSDLHRKWFNRSTEIKPTEGLGEEPGQDVEWLKSAESTPALPETGKDLDWLQLVGESEPETGDKAAEDWLPLPEGGKPLPSLDDVSAWADLDESAPENKTLSGEKTGDWHLETGKILAEAQPARDESVMAIRSSEGDEAEEKPATVKLDLLPASAPSAEAGDGEVPSATLFSEEASFVQAVIEATREEETPAFVKIRQEMLESQTGTQEIARAVLPEWVQTMQPVETILPETLGRPDTESVLEKAGPLAGLSGVLQPEALTARYRKPPVYTSRMEVGEKQKQVIDLLNEMISSENAPADVKKTRASLPGMAVKLILGFLLLTVVGVALAAGWTGFSPVLFAPEVKSFTSEVERLPANATVLLAMDVEPGRAGEMRISMLGIVEHLMARNTRLVLVSTTPAGPALAEDLLAAAHKKQRGYSLESQSINLGYLPGGTSSLKELAINLRKAAPISWKSYQVLDTPWSSPVLKGMERIGQFSAVVVLTDSAETARAWIEQVQPAMEGKPLLMGVSAMAGPVVRPYSNSGQIRGLVSGFPGGRMYDTLRGQAAGTGAYGGGYQAAMLFAALVAAAGLLLGILSMIFPKRKA